MSKHRYSYEMDLYFIPEVFHDGCAKRGIFSHQILNKNSLSLAHCALNRSFTVIITISFKNEGLFCILKYIFDFF